MMKTKHATAAVRKTARSTPDAKGSTRPQSSMHSSAAMSTARFTGWYVAGFLLPLSLVPAAANAYAWMFWTIVSRIGVVKHHSSCLNPEKATALPPMNRDPM